MYYELFETMETDDLVKKVSELTTMWRFYSYAGNAQLTAQIKDALDTAYAIIDEREFVRIHKEFTPPDGLVLDASKKRETKDVTPPKVAGRKPAL